MATYYKNLANQYIEKVSYAGVLTLFLGCFFFAFRGIWTHFVIRRITSKHFKIAQNV